MGLDDLSVGLEVGLEVGLDDLSVGLGRVNSTIFYLMTFHSKQVEQSERKSRIVGREPRSATTTTAAAADCNYPLT